MYLKVGDWVYWLCLLFSTYICVLFGLLSKKYGKEWSRKTVKILIWVNFALHFLKQFGPGYFSNWPDMLKRSTLENLCAALIVLSPLLLSIDKKWSKDYLMVFGFISGLCALIYPSSVIEYQYPLNTLEGCFELIRYFSCHLTVMLVGITMYFGKIHEFSYKRLWIMYIVFIAFQAIVLTSEYVSWTVGLSHWTVGQFFSRDYGNGTLAFGPYSSLDPYLSWAYKLVPSCFIHETSAGEILFTPLLWMLIPLLLLFPIMFLITLPINYDNFQKDFYIFRKKLSMKFSSFIYNLKKGK